MHIARRTVPAAETLATTLARRPALPPVASVWPVWLSTILARQTERRQLLLLDDRDLRDIGLTPSEARALAARPLWRR